MIAEVAVDKALDELVALRIEAPRSCLAARRSY